MTALTTRRPGLTAVQLILILALLLFALALLAPIVARLRSAAGRSQSQNNLKQMALGAINLTDTFKGRLPPAAGPFDAAKPDKVGTLHYYLLPFIEQNPLFQKGGQFDGSPWNDGVAATPVSLFVDPEDVSAPPQFVYKGWLATTSYPANWLVFDGRQRFPVTITDGTSNTLMFAQRYQMCGGEPTAWGYADLYYWTPMFGYYTTEKFQSAPPAQECDPARAQAIGGAVIQVAFCDGSARSIRPDIRPSTWLALCTPSGGEVIDDNAF